MEQIILIDNICMLGHTQGYISVDQLDTALSNCTTQYEHGAVYGAIAALAQFGIYVNQRAPAATRVAEHGIVLGAARPVDVQLPVRCWLELHAAADREGLDFAAATICNELAHIERKIAELLAGVQLPDSNADNDNGHEPDSTLKSFIPAPAHAEGS